MSEMTIENKKLMLAGMFLSKFNRQGLEALGYKSLQEAYNSFAFAVGGKPSSVKLYMQEFDPYFPNSRKGWGNRPIRPTRQGLIDEFGGLGLEEFSELVRSQFAGAADIDLAVGRVAVAAGVKSDSASTFEQKYRDFSCFKDCALQRTTAYGCGFDFKLTPPRGDFLAVEVKGLRTPSGQIQLTEKEFKMAQYLSVRFYLYVVTDFAHAPKPRVIENPLDAGITFEERSVKSEQSVWVAQISA